MLQSCFTYEGKYWSELYPQTAAAPSYYVENKPDRHMSVSFCLGLGSVTGRKNSHHEVQLEMTEFPCMIFS